MKTEKEKVDELVNLYINNLNKFKSEIKKVEFGFLFGIRFYEDRLTVLNNDFAIDICKIYNPSLGNYIKFLPENLKVGMNKNKRNLIFKIPKKEIDELFKAAEEIRSKLNWEFIRKNNFEYIPASFFKGNKLIKFLKKLSKIPEIFELMKRTHFIIDDLGTTWQY